MYFVVTQNTEAVLRLRSPVGSSAPLSVGEVVDFEEGVAMSDLTTTLGENAS